ncbi:hypothetical protein HDK90DRAFT_24575 [Phyllosticta capitalensis]|uniref:Nephrocystin 3-like N-terminal domain-containing protein n=1 Tax=Phyllosticta capitalensis TaxID=121624 RepID=A0ABR1Z3F5_9PEZI
MALKYVEFFDKLTGMMETLAIHLGHLHKLSEHPNLALLRESTAKVYGAILRFCHQAYGVFKKADDQDRSQIHLKTFLSTQWKPFEVQFGGVEKDIKDSLNALGHATGAETLNQTVQNGRTLDVLQGEAKLQTTILSEDRRHRYLHFISPLDFESIHKETLRKRCPGTGDWLLEHESFEDWFDNQDAQLLWCHGPPGVGKSMLSSIVMDHIQSHPTTMPESVGKAFVSFRYDQLESQDPAKVIAAILKQLAMQQKEFPVELVDFFSDHYKNARHPSAEKCTEMIATLGSRFAQTLIVMDALDECDEGPRERILNLIPEFKAKVFITSRPEPSIREAFNQIAVPDFEIDTKTTQEDIQKYVTGYLKSLTRPLDGDIEVEIADALISRANGSFLWVHLQLETIRRQKNPKDIRRVLQNLPRGLNDTYARILKKIEDQDETLRDLGFSCLLWVLNSRYPLSMDELRTAIATNETCNSLHDVIENRDSYSEIDILDSSCNLLTLYDDEYDEYEKKKRVRFVHYSVAEFLEHQAVEMRTLKDFWNKELMESKLAATCIQYLMLASPYEEASDISFHQYCAYNFDEHIIRAGEAHYQQLQTLLDRLLGKGVELQEMARIRCRFYSYVNPHPLSAVDIIYTSRLCELSVITGDSKWKNQVLHVHEWVLEFAIVKGSSDLVEKVLEHTSNPANLRLLSTAIAKGHASILRILLQSGADPNEVDPDDLYYQDSTLLEKVCGNWCPGDAVLEVTQILLFFGAKGREGDSSFSTALLGALLERDKHDTARLLLRSGATATTESLSAAAYEHANVDILDMILQQGIDPNILLSVEDDPYKRNSPMDWAASHRPLYHAAERGNILNARRLLESGARPWLKDHGKSATQVAALRGDVEMVELLLQYGDNVYPHEEFIEAFAGVASHSKNSQQEATTFALLDALDISKAPVLHIACMKGDLQLVKEVIRRGVDIHATTLYGEPIPETPGHKTALQSACMTEENQLEIIQTLLENGANTNVISGGGTALMSACSIWTAKDETVELLLEAGAKPDLAAGKWTSALECAARIGKEKAVNLLLSSGSFDQTQLDSALQAAIAWVDEPKILQLLLNHGANLRADKGASVFFDKGELALPAASRRGRVHLVTALLDAGADTNESDPWGSPLESILHQIHQDYYMRPYFQTHHFWDLMATMKCLRNAGATEPRADCHVGIKCIGPLCRLERHDLLGDQRFPPAELWIRGARYTCTKCTDPEVHLCFHCNQKIVSDGVPYRTSGENEGGVNRLDNDSDTAIHQANHEMTELLENDIAIQVERRFKKFAALEWESITSNLGRTCGSGIIG